MSFREKWLEAVDRKNSVLCAGLDPADFEMGRKGEGISENDDKGQWALEYVEAVAPFAAALKPNFNYWKGRHDSAGLYRVCEYAHDLGLVVIDDSKLADIGATNDAGIYYAAQRADAVTVAPFAGNLKELAEQGKKRNTGVITMCLMSNPEYEREKDKQVPLTEEEKPYFNNVPHMPQYTWLAWAAEHYGADGIVVGAPSKKNHIQKIELAMVRAYAGENMLVLLPGVGAQGGEAASIWNYFDRNNVIVNVGRDLMFPKDRSWQEAAGQYQSMLNDLRRG